MLWYIILTKAQYLSHLKIVIGIYKTMVVLNSTHLYKASRHFKCMCFLVF